MKQLTLKQILKRIEIQKGIQNNLFKHYCNKDMFSIAIKKTLLAEKDNVISVELYNNSLQFENTLHADKTKNIYLLESRLFDNKSNGMLSAYLEILDCDGNIIQTSEYINDVWDYANWEII